MREKIKEKSVKEELITFRCDREIAARLDRAASLVGKTRSKMIRHLVVAHIGNLAFERIESHGKESS